MTEASPTSAVVDLFAHREEMDARALVETAKGDRDRAARAYRFSPHGEIVSRRARFKEATQALLRAESELRDLLAFQARERSR